MTGLKEQTVLNQNQLFLVIYQGTIQICGWVKVSQNLVADNSNQLLFGIFQQKMSMLNRQNIGQELIESRATQHFISTLLKNKDYNRVNHKLKMYQSLLYDLQNPNLEDIKHLYILQNKIQQMNFILNEINLSCDQIMEDFYSIGFKTHTDFVDQAFSTVKILNEWLVKSLKGEFYSIKAEQNKKSKIGGGLCQLCEQSQAAAQLKRIKTQFGMEYSYDEQKEENKNIKREKQDIVVLEKEDFIDQLNLLLNKKDNLLKVAPETWRYKELVDSLNKMDQLNQEIQQRRQSRHQNYSSNEALALEDRKILEHEYQQILKEVKQILNKKFREGYSYRVRTMLDKFEVVLKDERDKKVEKKIFINIKDSETQTPVSHQTIQIKILKDTLAKKDIQMAGLKQSKVALEQRYWKMIQNQRKMVRVNNLSVSHFPKHDEPGHIFLDKFRENEELKLQIAKSKEQIYKLQREVSRERNERNERNERTERTERNGKNTSKKIENQLKTFKKLNQALLMKLGQCEQKQTKQTQTEILVTFNNAQSSFEQDMIEKFGKRKAIRKMSKQFIPTPVQDNIIVKTIADHIPVTINNKIQSYVVYVVVLPTTKQKKGSHIVAESDDTVIKQASNRRIKEEASKQNMKPNLNKTKGNISKKLKKVVKITNSTLKEPEVPKQQTVEEIKFQNTVQKSQVSESQSKTNYKKSNFMSIDQKMQIRRNSKVPLPSNFVRLAEVSNQKFRLNPPKVQKALINTDYTAYTYSNINTKDGVVKINRYQNQRGSRSIDREKVKEIVALLKMQKNLNPMSTKAKYANYFDKVEVNQNNARLSSDKSVLGDRENGQDNKLQENIAQSILAAKLIIEAQFSFLKAAGFIDYLFSLQKRMLLGNKSSVKYKFCFSHMEQEDLKLFGGPQQLVLYYKNIGIWKTLAQQENELHLNFRFRNFAQKISKYFYLLKKMNREFFEQYSSFIFNPFSFVMSHFGSQIKNQICQCVESIKEEIKIGQIVPNEETMTLIMIKLIKYHQICHGDCQHIPEFLDKVGYYRYAI